jgi:hypothetical protein
MIALNDWIKPSQNNHNDDLLDLTEYLDDDLEFKPSTLDLEILDYLTHQEIPPNILKQVLEDTPYVMKYCLKNKVQLKYVSILEETGKPEPAYYFSDNLGGYTRSGLEQSLS